MSGKVEGHSGSGAISLFRGRALSISSFQEADERRFRTPQASVRANCLGCGGGLGGICWRQESL